MALPAAEPSLAPGAVCEIAGPPLTARGCSGGVRPAEAVVDGPAPSATESHTVSTGQALASAGWLDAHYETCRLEYEALLRSVGIEPGWRVLDAGCGGG